MAEDWIGKLIFVIIFFSIILIIGWKIPIRKRQYSVKTQYTNSPEYSQQPRRPFSADTKRIVIIAQNGCCRICGAELAGIGEFDHIDGDKTNNTPTNCQALCPNCHRKKTIMQGMNLLL